MNETPKPDWTIWKNLPRLNAEEAAALTLNLDPAKLRSDIGDILDLDADLSSPSQWSAEIPADLISALENRLFMFRRIHGAATMVTPDELVTLANRFNWSIPDELSNLPTPAPPKAEPKLADETLSDNERTKLLKHIGALALLVAEHKSIYRKASDKEGNWHPNASQVAKGVVDHIAGLPGREGAGNSSLRDSIKAGVDLLNKVT